MKVRIIRSRSHANMISWTDKEGISEYEAKHQTYAALRGIAERRGYKAGWIYWRFVEIFGRRPNGEAVELASAAGHELLKWDELERAKYRKRKKEQELRLADVRGRLSGGGNNRLGDDLALMTDDDWGVKL